MLAAGVNPELLKLGAAELGVGHHAPDGLLDGALRAGRQQLAVGGRGQAAGVAGVAVGELPVGLAVGQNDLVGVDNDDVVAAVRVGGEPRLVLVADRKSVV